MTTERKVYGPYYDRDRNRWFLRFSDGNKVKSRSFKQEEEAQRFKEDLLGAKPAPESFLPSLPEDFGGSATEFKNAIAAAVVAHNQAARARDIAQMDVIGKYVRGLRDMSSAIVPHAKYIELEQEMADLAKYVEDIYANRIDVKHAKKPPTHRWAAKTVKGRKRPKQAVR